MRSSLERNCAVEIKFIKTIYDGRIRGTETCHHKEKGEDDRWPGTYKLAHDARL